MRGGLTFDDAFVTTRAEAEWLKSVADKALEEHPRKNGQRPRKRPSKSPPGRRTRTPLRRRRPERVGRNKQTGRDRQPKGQESSKNKCIGPDHTDWEARRKLACRKYNKGKCGKECPFRKDGIRHFCKQCGKPGHGADTCNAKGD